MLLIGGLEDQINLLVWSKVSTSLFSLSNPLLAEFPVYKNIFFGLLHPFLTTRPLLEAIVSSVLSIFGPNAYMGLLLVTLVANVVVSYLFFRRYKFGYVYALIFSFASYFWIHLVHISILSTWLIPLYAILFARAKELSRFRRTILMGIFFALAILFSNYLGFFLCLYYGFYTLAEFLTHYLFDKKLNFAGLVDGLSVGAVTFIIVVLSLLPYITTTYFSKTPAPVWLSLGQNTRPYEDFFSFSSRPWYFITPAVKNPLLGDVGSKIISSFESSGYFLSDDYFGGEHPENFYGYLFLITLIYSFFFGYRLLVRDEKKLVITHLLTIFLLFILMMPPFFTISGIKIYMPLQLVYKVLPMFRVTARLGILILFSSLVILATMLQNMFTKKKLFAKLLPYFMPVLLVVTLIETFVPQSVYKKDDPPFVYSYMSYSVSPESIFAVYPYDKTADALFWLDVHERLLINPRGYKDGPFDSALFTKRLSTLEGLKTYYSMGGDYLVVFKGIEDKDLVHFIDNPYYELEVELPESYLFVRK